MADPKSQLTLPDRLSRNPFNPFHVKEIFEHKIGIILNGEVRDDAEEYCISEGWIKVASPNNLGRKGLPLMITLEGTVEVYFDNYPS